MATDLFLEMAELPATGSLGTGQLDTRDLLVAGVPISISSKYLYLYLGLKVLTVETSLLPPNSPTESCSQATAAETHYSIQQQLTPSIPWNNN